MRNLVLGILCAIALVVAAGLLAGGALAIIVALVALALALLALPALAIHYDEHPERLERIHPR